MKAGFYTIIAAQFVSSLADNALLIAAIALLGGLAGYFIVPMNALLQHRGATLITAGHSIAVQNFNQNLAVLLMLGAYALLLRANMPVQWIIVTFGVFVCTMMWLAKRRSAANARRTDLRAMIES